MRGYPTIKFFGGGSKSRGSAEEYDGGRTADDIVRWAEEKAVASLPPPEIKQVRAWGLGGDDGGCVGAWWSI